ncbi:MAG: hypothetical protein OEV66_06540, partial [Spirochaetia bacterium]|nr:hypothetical protein [Spirochaetia bacterium]
YVIEYKIYRNSPLWDENFGEKRTFLQFTCASLGAFESSEGLELGHERQFMPKLLNSVRHTILEFLKTALI